MTDEREIGKIVLFVMLMAMCAVGQGNSTEVPEIYGVRWALGQHYQFTIGTNPNNEYYVVIFNSDSPISGELFLTIS